MSNIKMISVDYQYDFINETQGNCVNFNQSTLFPFLLKNNIKIHEIMADYRLPRLGHSGNLCNPETSGFQSAIPESLKTGNPWIKCMHSPIWIRDNIGVANLTPGTPYQDPQKFTKWLIYNIGEPKDGNTVYIIGLTMDCCVLATVQELYHLGYRTKLIYESTDPMNERLEYKNFIAFHSSLTIYTQVISFKEFESIVEKVH